MKSDFLGSNIHVTSFSSDSGSTEYFVYVHITEEYSLFSDTIEEAHRLLTKACTHFGLEESHLIFSRLFLSDIINQKQTVCDSSLFPSLSQAAFSIVEQSPLNGGWINLLAYYIKDIKGNTIKRRSLQPPRFTWYNTFLFELMNYKMLWIANYTGFDGSGSLEQTKQIFTSYQKLLDDQNMSILRNVVRTWLFVRDIDNNYKGMVSARRNFFENHGITPDANYPASTGIEGKAREVDSLVVMDGLAIGGLKDGQIVKMEALENLSPTIAYGVTFERGLRIRYGDRSHLHISGTASIDKRGRVLHSSDTLKQLDRTLENINALLSPHNATLEDMAYFILYLRDSSAYASVSRYLRKVIPESVPVIPMQAAVCRPEWLVELEGVAIINDSNDFEPFC